MADTTKTGGLINELVNVMKQGRYLLLTGGSGVGKTYIAKRVAEELVKGKGTVTVVPIHQTYGYSDFVTGISFSAENGGFVHTDKIFLTELKKARDPENANNKYVLILDDIGRGMITGILGDVLSLIEPHGNSDTSIPVNGELIKIPSNFYIIATRSTLTDSLEPSGYGFSRHFYHRHIEADHRYMSNDNGEPKNDILSARDMFCKTRAIVSDNLRYGGSMSGQDKGKYLIGHGVFNGKSTLHTMKYQVLPMLKQYVKEGILDKNGTASKISSLEKSYNDSYIKSETTLQGDVTIKLPVNDNVNRNDFAKDTSANTPIVNLVFRICQQGLLNHDDIKSEIISNANIYIYICEMKKKGHAYL